MDDPKMEEMQPQLDVIGQLLPFTKKLLRSHDELDIRAALAELSAFEATVRQDERNSVADYLERLGHLGEANAVRFRGRTGAR